MFGQKKRRKRTLEGAVTIDGYNLVWTLLSEPQWTGDQHTGLCISAKLATGQHRELVIEYPYDKAAGWPQWPRLTAAIVEADLLNAMNDGWSPESRGRPYRFMAETKLEPGRAPA